MTFGPEGMMVSCGGWHNGQPENGAIAVRAAAVSRAIEIAVAALHQPGRGICAIIAAGEGIQSGSAPHWC